MSSLGKKKKKNQLAPVIDVQAKNFDLPIQIRLHVVMEKMECGKVIMIEPVSRCKCKQDSVGVRRILVVPRDSVGTSAGFCWCIWGEMADEVAAPCKSTATQGRAALRMK